VHLKAVALESGFAVVADGGGQKVVLNIGPAYAGLGANEPAALEVVGGAEALFRQQPAGAEARLARGERCPFSVMGSRQRYWKYTSRWS
jgi:hypothetical protein